MKILRKIISLVLVTIIFLNMSVSYVQAATNDIELTQVSQPRMQGSNGMSFDLAISPSLPGEGVIADIDKLVTIMGAGSGFNFSSIYGFSIGPQLWLIFDGITSSEMASIANGATVELQPGSFTLNGVSYNIINGFKMEYNAVTGIWSTVASGNTNEIEITQVNQPRMQGTNGMSFDLGISSSLPAEGVIADIGNLVTMTGAGTGFNYSSIYGYSIKSQIWLIFDGISSSEMASIQSGATLTLNPGTFTLNGTVYNITNSIKVVYDAESNTWGSNPIEIGGLADGCGVYDTMAEDENFTPVVFNGVGRNTVKFDGEGGGWLLYLSSEEALPGISNDSTIFTGIQMSVNGGPKFSRPIIHSSDYGMAFIHLIDNYLPAGNGEFELTLYAGTAASNNSYPGIQVMCNTVITKDKDDNWTLEKVPMWRVRFACAETSSYAKDTFSVMAKIDGADQEITVVYDGSSIELVIPFTALKLEADSSKIVTLPKGNYIGKNGTKLPLTKEIKLYINDYGVSQEKEIEIETPDVELVLSKDGKSTSKNTITLTTRLKDLTLANGELAVLSGVVGDTYYLKENGCFNGDELLKDARFVANNGKLELVLNASEITNGTEILLKGLYKLGNSIISFQPIILTWNEVGGAGTWNISLPNTYIQGDANADGVLSIHDLVRAKRHMLQNEAEDTVGINIRGTNIIANDDTIDNADTKEMRINLLGGGQIEMAAYSGPGYRYDSTKQNADNWVTEQDFQDYMDCGFTYLFPEGDAAYDRKYNYSANARNTVPSFAQTDLFSYMKLAERMNIPVVPFDYRIVDIVDNQATELTYADKKYLSQMVKDLSQFSNFKGVTLRDEPSINSVTAVTLLTDYLNTLMPDMFSFTSNHPMYCGNNKLLTNDTSKDLVAAYKEYVDKYSTAYNTYAYDSYPLLYTKVTNYYWSETPDLEDTWFQNLELVAQSAKTKGYDPGITIQSTAYKVMSGSRILVHKRPITSKADVGFQMYTALAYGMKSVNYYTYWGEENSDLYTAMVDYKADGTIVKTAAYDAVRDVNWEIKQFDHVLMDYKWRGTQVLSSSSSGNAIKKTTSYSDERIVSASSNNDAIIGCMQNERGRDGYMLVNATDPGLNKTATLTVTFKDATKATAYINGVEQKITINGGNYTFELAPGEGVFVVLD